MDVKITQAKVLDQEDIDKALNMKVVKGDFTNENGDKGHAMAFLGDYNVLPRDLEPFSLKISSESYYSFMS